MTIDEIMKRSSNSRLVRLLEKLDAVIPTPRKSIAKLEHIYSMQEPHLKIEKDAYNIYETLMDLGYAVDVKDFRKPHLSLKSLEDGVIPQHNLGEDIVAAKMIDENRRIHARMWRDRTDEGNPCYRVEVHTETYPVIKPLKYPDTIFQWITNAFKHLKAKDVDFTEGRDIFFNDIKERIKVYNHP